MLICKKIVKYKKIYIFLAIYNLCGSDVYRPCLSLYVFMYLCMCVRTDICLCVLRVFLSLSVHVCNVCMYWAGTCMCLGL